MIKTVLYRLLAVWLLMMGAHLVDSQTIYWTEDDIDLQRTYIEANTQKLIGNVDKALTLYQEVIGKKRNIDPAWYEIARMQHAKDDNEAALISINKAIKINPNNIWYTSFKVDLYDRMGLFDDAVAAIETYLATNEADQNMLERLAHIYAKSNESAKAIHVYNQLESKYGVHESYSKKKYNLYSKLGKDEQSIDEIKNLVGAYPTNIDYLHLLAGKLLHTQKIAEADQIFKRILTIDPDDTKASIAMAQTYREEGNISEFIKSISSIIANPDLDVNVKIQELIPPLNRLIDRPDLALSDQLIKASRLLIKAHPYEPKVYAISADIYFHSGQYGEAARAYEQTLDYNNTIYTVWEQYLYTLVLLNKPEQVLSAIEAALNIFPNQGRLFYFEGLASFKIGKYQDSEAAINQALLMSRKNLDLRQYVLSLQAGLKAAQAQKQKSIELLDIAIEISPNQADPILNGVIEDLGPRDQVELLTYALERIKNKNIPPALFSAALIHYLQKKYKKALTPLNQAIKSTPFIQPKMMDLYIGIHEAGGLTDGPYIQTYTEALEAMGYQRVYIGQQP